MPKQTALCRRIYSFWSKKCISKTIQNETLEIAATQIRQFYRDCLMICPHFSVIADEVTSHGKEILSVCLRFLEVRTNTEFVAKKHEVRDPLGFSLLRKNHRGKDS